MFFFKMISHYQIEWLMTPACLSLICFVTRAFLKQVIENLCLTFVYVCFDIYIYDLGGLA